MQDTNNSFSLTSSNIFSKALNKLFFGDMLFSGHAFLEGEGQKFFKIPTRPKFDIDVLLGVSTLIFSCGKNNRIQCYSGNNNRRNEKQNIINEEKTCFCFVSSLLKSNCCFENISVQAGNYANEQFKFLKNSVIIRIYKLKNLYLPYLKMVMHYLRHC